MLALSGGLMFALAAQVDKCTEKFNTCKTTCTNEWYQCKGRGSEIEACDFRRKQCNKGCDADLKKCQGNNAQPSPAKPPKKK